MDFVRGSHVPRRLAISGRRRRRVSKRIPAHLRCAGLRILRSREGVELRCPVYRLSVFFCVCTDKNIYRKKWKRLHRLLIAPRNTYIHQIQPPLSHRTWMWVKLSLAIICASDTEAQTANAKSQIERGRAGIPTRQPKWI